jgi:hypothetical protein
MTENDRPNRNILGKVGRFAVGFGLIAAAGAMASRNRGVRPDLRPGSRSLDDILRQRPTRRRKPPASGIAAPANPPRGPLPMQGGAAAPLDFEV